MKNIDPSEINIINYLTGEMSAEELNQFELQLSQNQLLKTQVVEMKKVQDQLGAWNNSKVEIPNIEIDKLEKMPIEKEASSDAPKNTREVKYSFPNWMKYAAVFLGFGILLQVTGFKVNQQGNTLMLSFGEPKSESLNSSDVDAIIAQALDKYGQAQNSELADFKNQVNSDLGQISNAVNGISVSNEENLSQLKRMINRNMDTQYVGMQSMVRDFEDNQRQELEDSFTGIAEHIENNRVTDQIKIQNAFSEIATAINNQQYQTNALLTSISSEDTSLKSY